MAVPKALVIRRARDVRERRWFEIERGSVNAFAIQPEVRVEINWEAVVRWDNAHGFVDCDRYTLKGEKQKTILNVTAYEGLTRAQDDLNRNWQRYRQRFLEGLWP